MWPLFALLLGLAVGSFLNVVVHRLPRGESVAYPPSRCPQCGHRLGPWDLVPVLSYLALKGRCRYCARPISPRYPLVEALTGGLFLLASLFYPPGVEALLVFLFLAFLVALAFIDVDTFELPDPLTYGLLFLGLLASWALAFPLPFRESLDGSLMAAGGLALVAGYGNLFLRRFREARAEVPVGPHQVHMAALFGALLGPGVGMALAFLAWALSARTGRPVVLPDRLTLPLLPLAFLLAPALGLDFLESLKGSLLAAGGLALAGGLYWAFRPLPEEEEEPVAMGYGDVKLLGALGAWLGPYAFLALFLGVFAGALLGLLLRQSKLAFGPYLGLGGVVAFALLAFSLHHFAEGALLCYEAFMGRAVKVALAVLALGLSAFALYLWASPYLFLRALQGAVLEGDRARLERLVDFPRVREGLKAQVQARLLRQMGQEVAQNPLAGLAYLFVAGMVDPMVDALVSPEGLAALGTGLGPGEAPKEAVKGWRLAYQDFRTAYVYRPEDPSSRLYLERQGLFGWKVVRMELPLE